MRKVLNMKKQLLLAFIILTTLSSCSRIIVNKVSDALSGTGEGSVFTRDNDPELMRDALPLALKMYEALLDANPEHVELHRATASAFVSYSYAFIQFPADTLPTSDISKKKQMLQRSKKMYIRAREYALDGLELQYPSFRKGLSANSDSTLALVEKEDVSMLYWAGMAWFGAFTADKFDMKLALSVPKAVKIMKRVEALDPDFGNGALDEFFISFYGAMPKSMGGDVEKAKHHFERAVTLSKGKSAGPYTAYATAVMIPAQDRTQYEALLKKAKKIKPHEVQDELLYRTIQHEKAVWYLNHIDDYFIE